MWYHNSQTALYEIADQYTAIHIQLCILSWKPGVTQISLMSFIQILVTIANTDILQRVNCHKDIYFICSIFNPLNTNVANCLCQNRWCSEWLCYRLWVSVALLWFKFLNLHYTNERSTIYTRLALCVLLAIYCIAINIIFAIPVILTIMAVRLWLTLVCGL